MSTYQLPAEPADAETLWTLDERGDPVSWNRVRDDDGTVGWTWTGCAGACVPWHDLLARGPVSDQHPTDAALASYPTPWAVGGNSREILDAKARCILVVSSEMGSTGDDADLAALIVRLVNRCVR